MSTRIATTIAAAMARASSLSLGVRKRYRGRRHLGCEVCAAVLSHLDDVLVDPGVLPGTEWADRALVRPALAAENVLLADLLAGRIDRTRYRGRLHDLASLCEPAPGTRR